MTPWQAPSCCRALFAPRGEVGAAGDALARGIDEETPSAAGPLLFIVGVGGLLVWATLSSERKRRRSLA